MTEQWSANRSRKQAAGPLVNRWFGKIPMGRVADQVPARGVAPPLQFKRD